MADVPAPGRTYFQFTISKELIVDVLAYGLAGCVPLDPVLDVGIEDARLAKQGAHGDVTLLLSMPRADGGTSWETAPTWCPRFQQGQPMPRVMPSA